MKYSIEDMQHAYTELNKKERLPIGLLAMVLHIAGCWLLQLNPLLYLLAPVCAGIAISMSKVRLSKLQDLAIDRAKMGRLGVEKEA